MEMTHKSKRSKRKYPERDCKNPDCGFEKRFTPHDRRQIYCCDQCRWNYNNDQTYKNNRTIFKNEKSLRQFDKRLEKIYTAFVDAKGYCKVWKGFFEYENINVGLLIHEQKNLATGGRVKWFYNYGTEQHAKDPDYFIIHKKSK